LTNYLIVIQDITERKKLEADLYQAKNELELRVVERTAELLKINEQLKLEIAERKKAKEKLLEINEQNLQLLSSITSIVIGVSKDDLIFQWNQVAEKTFGIPATAVIGKPFSECSINWNWKEVSAKIQLCREKQESVFLDEFRYQRPDGSDGLLGLTVNPIGKGKDSNISFFLFGVDITDRKKSEARRALSQKLESIGQLAAGIAHEINSPIQYVGDNLHFIEESFGKLKKMHEGYEQLVKAQSGNCNLDLAAEIDNLTQTMHWPYLKTEIPKAIEQSLEGVARVTKIVRAMKDFSHPSQGVKVSADINQALESTVTISKNEWKYVADLIADFDPELPAVECIIEEINQVVLNMIINAVDAIKETNLGPNEKGEIVIKTRNKKDFVEIMISDTGVGMPPEILAKIFDPFFTTKEVGKGTGQGLTLAHDIIVNKHNGSIEAESEPGKGTTFRILLPVKGAPPKGESEKASR
jgi:PAS domain S-box-containing protein